MTIYKVKFSAESKEYRIRMIQWLDDLEICGLSTGEVLIKCDDDDTAACVEYELRKAERRDECCIWEKII